MVAPTASGYNKLQKQVQQTASGNGGSKCNYEPEHSHNTSGYKPSYNPPNKCFFKVPKKTLSYGNY